VLAATVAMMTDEPTAVPPDDKDWTWVLREPCPECGFDAHAMNRCDVPAYTRIAIAAFVAVLGRPGAAERPAPGIWSPLEYACHVRDVCLLFDKRLQLMLAEDDPLWANWDQDETAAAAKYWAQDPATVAAELPPVGDAIAASFAAVEDDEWQRPGRRSNGSVFTVDTLGRYFVHDLRHHVHDIGG
jgi:hypothetical protein